MANMHCEQVWCSLEIRGNLFNQKSDVHVLTHLTSLHFTSPHLTSPHLTSPHLTSPHLTAPHLTTNPNIFNSWTFRYCIEVHVTEGGGEGEGKKDREER
jgi:hypothetical protein